MSLLIDTWPLSVAEAHPACGDPCCVFCASRIIGVPEWQLRMWSWDGVGPEHVGSRWEPRYERAALGRWMTERAAAIAEIEQAVLERQQYHVIEVGPPIDVATLVADDRAKAEAEWAQTMAAARAAVPEHQPYIARRLWRVADRKPGRKDAQGRQ